MSHQLPAVSPTPVDDYEEIEAAVMETSRGRAFLLEYARRLRAAETAQVLAALARLEQRIAAPQTTTVSPDLHEAVSLVRQRLLDIAASAQSRGADARVVVEIETQARALRRLLPEDAPAVSAQPQSAWPAPAVAHAPAPPVAIPQPRTRASRAAAFAAIDAMDLRERAAMFA